MTENLNKHPYVLSKMVKEKQLSDMHLYGRVAAILYLREHLEYFTFICSLLGLVLDAIMDCSLEPAKTTPRTWRLSPATHAP